MTQFSIKSHHIAVLQALLVTFLWSTSWVLIKIGLADIPSLVFAGLRYCLAFICLLPFLLQPSQRLVMRHLTGRQWGLLILLGLLYYTIVQGALFVGLDYLPAATASLILSFTTVVVALMGTYWLAEQPGWLGWSGVGLSLVGAFLYFHPISFPDAQWIGILVVILGMLANSGSSVLGRFVNNHESLPALVVTGVCMGIGGILLLVVGLLTQGLPALSLKSGLIIAWLALINTAFAFTLWNYTLRTLPAMESSLINNAMLIQIALLAWVFLGEGLSVQKWVGILLTAAGVVIMQFRK